MRFDVAAGARFDPTRQHGHYESWFLRANHRCRPLGLWCRYTIFSPSQRPESATAELWAVWFDGERDDVIAVREDVPLANTSFSLRGLDVRVGEARLTRASAKGRVTTGMASLAWDLSMAGGDGVLPFLPEVLSRLPTPKAKSVTLAMNLVVSGRFDVVDRPHFLEGWVGSLNHNWGSQHTDEYAWGQVTEFDGAPGTFLECIRGQILLAPRFGVRSPWITVIALRHEGRTRRLASFDGLVPGPRPYDVGHASFVGRALGLDVAVRLRAPSRHFVGLAYRNPPGGIKVCHNTKIASAEVVIRERGREVRLLSRNRAAFEVLSDHAGPNVVVLGAR